MRTKHNLFTAPPPETLRKPKQGPLPAEWDGRPLNGSLRSSLRPLLWPPGPGRLPDPTDGGSPEPRSAAQVPVVHARAIPPEENTRHPGALLQPPREPAALLH